MSQATGGTPALPQTTDYAHGITAIDTEQLREGLACCYLLESNGRYAFVECGTALSVPGLLRVLDARGIAREQVDYVMPTHVHLDHAGGAGTLMQALPNARLVVHPRGARHLIDPSKLIEGATAVYGPEYMARTYGNIVAVPESRVLVAEDGTEVEFGGRRLVAYDAPGHARHHYALWDEASRGLFTGDVFGLSYREFDGPKGPFLFVTSSPVQFEPQAWQQTLDRLLALSPQFAYLTHYGEVGQIEALAAELRAGLEAYQQLARAAASAKDRHAALFDALMSYELERFAALDAPLPRETARDLLQLDIELNTQGLEVWLDRH